MRIMFSPKACKRIGMVVSFGKGGPEEGEGLENQLLRGYR